MAASPRARRLHTRGLPDLRPEIHRPALSSEPVSKLSAAVRWEWISTNPAEIAKKPRQPTPPTPEQASKIVTAAWEQDPDWGTLVWLIMVTGLRRAEILALRWSDLDLATGYVTIRRNYVRVNGRNLEKDTKSHQMRRVSLDPATVDILTEHRQRYEDFVRQLDAQPTDSAFLFSHKATYDRPYDPSDVTHRYARMCANALVSTAIYTHYSITRQLNYSPLASTSARSPGALVTLAVEL